MSELEASESTGRSGKNDTASPSEGRSGLGISDAYFDLHDDGPVKQDDNSMDQPEDLLKQDLESGISISDAYNDLSESDRKSVYSKMTASDSGLDDLIITGVDTDGDGTKDSLKDVFDFKTGKDLYTPVGQSDNTQDDWNGRWRSIYKGDREFFDRAGEMLFGYKGHVEPTVNGITAGGYRRDSVEGMIEKHGFDRFKETVDRLAEMGGSAKFYSFDFTITSGDGKADQDEKMARLDTLMEPGNLEAAKNLHDTLEVEGYEKKLSMKEMTDLDFVKLMTDSPEERKAFIDLSKMDGPKLKFWGDHGDQLEKMKPTERLEAYKEYKADFERELEEKKRPFVEEIKEHGQPVGDALERAMLDNKVLIIGEQHRDVSPHRETATEQIDHLKAGGATHFAVELTEEQLKNFQEDGDMNHLPSGLRSQDYVDLINKAEEKGLKLVAANTNGGEQERDDHMKDVIEGVLREDPNNKVVFWVGALHGADTTAGQYKSTADLLREDNIPVATVMEQSEAARSDPVYQMNAVDKPTAIFTKDTPKISNLELSRIGNDIEERYGLWDMVIIYPQPEAEKSKQQ